MSLTNTDYKIIAFTLAKRLQKVIDKLISYDQSAYIKGRFIGINARTIVDIYEYCEENDIDGILLFLDFQKAFDSVEWNFMFRVLKMFNFGETFIEWVRILYENPIFRLKNNGWVSKTCKMHRGIRQGCPISAMIFLFVTEILAIQIRNNKDIRGFNIAEDDEHVNDIKIVQHADDCTLPLRDELSMEVAIGEINKFSNVSGMKLNVSKTECVLLGKLKNRNVNTFGVKINTTCLKTLGVYIGHDKELCYRNNWIRCITDMEKLFESWKTRNLTLFGKCSVVNTLAISKLVYVASILKLPDQKEIKYINKLIFSFLWCNKDRIKRNTMIGTIEQGGIGVVDIESKLKAIKASWIGKLLNCKCKLKYFLNILCDKVGVDFIYITHTNEIKLSHYSIVHNLPLFYQQIFVSFNECKSFQTNVIATENFLSQPLWNNRFIMYKGKTLCFMDWIKSGLRYVKDIVDENGLKPPEWFLFHLVKKRNWLCEYNIMKFCLRRLCMKYELYKTNFVNEICTHKIYFRKSCFVNPKDYKCKLFYSILRDKKFDAPSHQSFLSRMFNIQRKSSWSAIYTQKISNIYDKKVAEFNFKMMHNLLSNRYILSKCKHDIDRNCLICNGIIENNEHLIYSCSNVVEIWSKASHSLKFNISWKNIVIGFYDEVNDKTVLINNIISFIAYRIYKYKMFCRIHNNPESYTDLRKHVKFSLQNYYFVLSKTSCKHNIALFKKISDVL